MGKFAFRSGPTDAFSVPPRQERRLAGRKGRVHEARTHSTARDGLCLVLLLGRPPLRARRKVRLDLPLTTRSRRRLTITASSSKMKRSGFLEVTINPGEKEPFHEHPLFSVMNIITGAPLRITPGTLQDGQIVTGKTIEVGKDNFQPSAALDASSRRALSGERRDGGLSRVSHRAERG
jgi:hypothetical protein